MTTPRDVDPIIATWLDDGPIDLPVQTRRAIEVGLRTQSRVRRMAFPGGITMLPLIRLASAAAIVVAVGAVSILLFSNRNAGVASSGTAPPASAPPSAVAPSASASAAAASEAASAPLSTEGWRAFSSTRYGYNIRYAPTWTSTPSTRTWTFAKDQKDWMTSAADHFLAPASRVLVTGFAVDLPTGTTRDAWIASYHGPDASGKADVCGSVPVRLGTTEVDGHPVVFTSDAAKTSECGGTAAFVLVNKRLYVFSVWVDGEQPMLEALLSTVTFQP